MQRRNRSTDGLARIGFLAVLVLLAAIVTACADTFDPIDRGETPFSVFGYLDASADTQWIRVNALRDATLVSSPDPSGVRVTLTELGTGRTIVLRDTALPYVNMLGSEPVYAHNFWTTERLQPGASYRFRAEAPDGAISEALVRIPPDYRLEVWVSQPTSDMRRDQHFPYLRVEGVKQLAFVRYFDSPDDPCYVSGRCGRVVPLQPGGDSVARMLRAAELRAGAAQTIASGAEWPFGEDYSVWSLVPDSLASNVAGAVGFLGGVLTKKTWTGDCALPFPSPPGTYCKLRFDSTTATLRGSVPVAGSADTARIELRELEPPTGEQPRTLFGATATGPFLIGAIRPGRHQITIQSSLCMLTDTVQLVAGQVLWHIVSTCR